MKINRYLIASIAGMLAAPVWADSAPKTLNLNLPPTSLVTESTNATTVNDTGKLTPAGVTTRATTSTPAATSSWPHANRHYDASANAIVDAADSRNAACDDTNYAEPQIHGDIGMGVVAGNHVSGNYQTGTLNITKATGSCDHPTGDIGISISVGRGHFNGRDHRGRHW